MSGSAFSQATVFALGIQPYINASIIIELLTIAIPALERLAKEDGEEGRKKIQNITRYTTIGLGVLMGFAYYVMLKNYSLLEQDRLCLRSRDRPDLYGRRVLPDVDGRADQRVRHRQRHLDDPLCRYRLPYPAARQQRWFPRLLRTARSSGTPRFCSIVGILAIMIFIVFITNSERRIPVQYAKRVVGRKMYGGQSTHLPIKVNMSGVLPIIFAQSIASLPATIIAFTGTSSTGFWAWMNKYVFDNKSVVYMVCYFLLIIAFSYFYATIQFNPIEIANNLKKNGGFIPGFRPGKPTADFILKVINKITLFGALYLAIVAILPIIVGNIIGNSSLAIGGTSVIIVVGVALETVKAMEAQMLMRHYKGFLE